MVDRVRQQLGNYRLIRLLGEGGFAEVYLGEHIYLKTQAAIKVLQMRLANEEREGFLKEARIIAGLKHPHIIRVLDFGIDAGTPFLVMDYAPHGTLRKHHPKGVPLPLPTIVNYVKQIAPALQYAHERKLVHRDVKPENLLLDEDNEVLLSDFGIALVTQSSRYQNTQEVVGTAAYMAPEQLQGKPRPASDQYSLGIVVYEWLCGDRPFHGTFTELYSQHLFVPPAPLSEKVPDISREVEQVVLTTLEKDPHKRFASVQALATALEQAYQQAPAHQAAPSIEVPLSSEPSLPSETVAAVLPTQLPQPTNVVTPPSQSLQPTDVVTPSIPLSQPTIGATPTHALAVPPPPTEESIPSDRSWPSQLFRHRTSRRAVVGSLVGLVIVGGGITWLALTQKPQLSSHSFHPAGSPTTKPTLIPVGTTLITYRGHSDWLLAVAWSPNGKYIASAGWKNDKTVQMWDASTGNSVYINRHHSDYVYTLAWSPDNKRIASGSADQTIQVWDALTGNHIVTHSYHSGANGVAWSPDSKRIASGLSDTTVQVWDAATGDNILYCNGTTSGMFSVAWSSNGKLIASGGDDGKVQVWDAASGNHLFTYGGKSNYEITSVAWSPDSKHIAWSGVDKTVQVWDTSTGSHILTYQGHSDIVWFVAWSPDGKRIASGSTDATVQVWDASTGSNVFIYRGHSDGVYSLAWSPDGKRIASGSADRTVQVWQAV